MTAVGVLCARVRVEEKQIIAAIDQTGLVAVPVPPAGAPLPPGPASREFAMLGEFLDATTGETMSKTVQVLVDRATNRAVASATLPLLQGLGITTIDAGVAAHGTRLQVASVLATAGIPRPASLFGFSEESSVAAVNRLGYPSTLLGLTPGSTTTVLHDADTADAVIEHRVVLGEASEAIVVLQAGAPAAGALARVHVIGGRAIAVDGASVSTGDIAIAEQAARALRASLVAVELYQSEQGTVVWDVLPVSDFRQARLLGETSVAAAIAAVARDKVPVTEPVPAGATNGLAHTFSQDGEERHHGYALSA